MNHAAESLNKIVEDLVKTWEMEASHKKDFSQWTTVDHANYKIRANGGKFFSGEESKEKGNYNVLLVDCPKHIYDANKEDFKSSHDLFRNAFSKGFPWELIEVFSGPPNVCYFLNLIMIILSHRFTLRFHFRGDIGAILMVFIKEI
jgi:hypothetical protein